MVIDITDILYRNIKHAFFQPAENELVVLLHFRLRHPIMLGKKSVHDIQFYTEVAELSHTLIGQSKRSMFEDEFDEERQEREQRKRLNLMYQNFVKQVEETFNPTESKSTDSTIEFDIPYRDLGFHGAPGRGRVFLQPTVNCLVQLIEPPYFILTLSDVEIVHFERIQFGLREFDMVFVFHDYSRPVEHINSVPIEAKDSIQEWLDSCNIKFYSGPQNLNWKRIMQEVQKDPQAFFEGGGWDFLDMEKSDDEDGQGSGSSSEDDEGFDPEEDGVCFCDGLIRFTHWS